jgi:hypothetical protein
MPPNFPPPSQSAPLWLLNAPIITADGLFRCRTICLDEARRLIETRGFESAIGHAPTAAVLSDLLAIECPMRRVEFRQTAGQQAIIFRLARRIEEGRVLHSRAEIEQTGYSFLLLTREE